MEANPRVSIILGTWNRLPVLRQCLEAIRKSIAPVPYEVVVVDGGSTDGTLEWLAEQADTTAIRQGRLVGACRAFNAGFRLARAPFTVHLNDDDLPLDDCLARSVRFMEEHPRVGQAAYAFDMWGAGRFHHDSVFGKHYANKGITRRELGDRAQWWTELFYTYAGDCELSCRILEMGYETVALPDCKCHDLQTRDELRRVNNPEGYNPDSKTFYDRRQGLNLTPCRERRILHIALNVGQDTQPALTRALSSMGEYRQVDWRADKSYHDTIGGICQEWNPALVFMQFQTSGTFSREYIEQLRAPGRTVVSWSGDVREPMPSWYADLGHAFDLTLVTNLDWADALRADGVKADYLQIGFNQEMYHPWGSVKPGAPIVFMGSHYGDIFPLSQERLAMVKTLKKVYKGEFAVYGNGWPFETWKLTHAQEAATYRGCKIAIGISQLELRRYTSDRLFRAMGCGPLYLARWRPGIELDFERGVHLDWWRTLDELEEKINYYLAHDTERQKIAQAGMELVHTRHTWLDRIYELGGKIGWHQWK